MIRDALGSVRGFTTTGTLREEFPPKGFLYNLLDQYIQLAKELLDTLFYFRLHDALLGYLTISLEGVLSQKAVQGSLLFNFDVPHLKYAPINSGVDILLISQHDLLFVDLQYAQDCLVWGFPEFSS